jgi:hypothetical protein
MNDKNDAGRIVTDIHNAVIHTRSKKKEQLTGSWCEERDWENNE